MKLKATLALYAGGEGSGCNPEVGHCGRHPGASPTGLWPGESTQDHYKDMISGQYTSERAALHEKIVTEMTAGKHPNNNKTPVAYVLGGGTASGKTTASRKILGEQPHVLRIDPDEIKLKIPEYEQLKKEDPENAAFRVHEESSDLTKKVMGEAIARKLDLTYDSTTTGKSSTAMVRALLDHGYDVHLMFVDVPLKVAKERALIREKKSGDPMNFGRHVPENVISEAHHRAAANFFTLKDIPELKSVNLYDNTDGPKLIYSKEQGGTGKVHDQDLFERFHKKAKGELEARAIPGYGLRPISFTKGRRRFGKRN